jgi:hypothetical protein
MVGLAAEGLVRRPGFLIGIQLNENFLLEFERS